MGNGTERPKPLEQLELLERLEPPLGLNCRLPANE
jgi:hypothetical protein